MRDKEITAYLKAWRGGDEQALVDLMPLVFDELHKLARSRFASERSNHTLQPTALISECFMRLCKEQQLELVDRHHFYAIAGRQMRQILIDHARVHGAKRRGEGKADFVFEDADSFSDEPGLERVDLLALDQALQKLRQIDEQQHQIVELRFFAGLSAEETAEVMGITKRTVMRKWAVAKKWLHRFYAEAEPSQGESDA